MRAQRRDVGGEAPGEIIIAIGSPGTTRSSTKTMTATPDQGDRRHAETMQQRWPSCAPHFGYGSASHSRSRSLIRLC